MNGPETQEWAGIKVEHVWTVEREGGERRTLTVRVTDSARVSAETLPDPSPDVIASQGRAAVEGFLHWREPPPIIRVDTKGIDPLPGSPDPRPKPPAPPKGSTVGAITVDLP